MLFVQKILEFDFSTLMLFRCTKRKFAESFQQGKIRFNQPKYWIDEAQKGNVGLGDLLEGTCMSVRNNDESRFVKKLKQNSKFNHFDSGEYTYFRRKNVENLYCLCFYGLNDNTFVERYVEKNGKVSYLSRVKNEYFTDFSRNLSKKDYEKIELEEQPVVIFVSDYSKLFDKIKQFFSKFGITEDEIIISPVEYINKKSVAVDKVPYPLELLLKDNRFKLQSEIRIIINSQNEELLEYMEKNNNIIDVGNIEDITNIYDYYFEDMLIKRTGRNSILFNLPKSEVRDLRELEFKELLGILVQTRNDELPQELGEDEKKQIVEYIKDIVKEKYNVYIDYDSEKKLIEVCNCSREFSEYLNVLCAPTAKRIDFEQLINGLINNKDYDKVYEEFEKIKSDEELYAKKDFFEGKIFEEKMEYDKAINAYTKSLKKRTEIEKALDARSTCYYKEKKFDLAIKDLELLQEQIGYNEQIYTKKGINLLEMNKKEEAIIEFGKAIQINEKHASAYYNRSVAYWKCSNFKEAKKDIAKAMEYAPLNQFYKNEYNKFYKNL